MNSGTASRVMSIGLFVLFVSALSLALVAGVRSYAGIVESNGEVSAQRVANGAISNTLHAMDSYDAIGSDKLDHGQALIIRENTDVGIYENRIYLWRGNIILEFAPAGDPYVPERGIELVESSTFDFSINGSLVTITTDEGTTDVNMRAGVGNHG